jgi:hypothetical protein
MRSGTLGSAHVAVAVILAASAPAHAISEGDADIEGHPRVTDFGPDHAGAELGYSAPHRLLTAHDTIQPRLVTLGSLRRSHRHGALALGARGDRGPRRSSADSEKAAGASRLPAKRKLDGKDTANSLSKHYYGSSGGALTILWSIGLKKWRPGTKIVESKRYKAGDTILIPKPPKASINPPSRDAATDPCTGGVGVAGCGRRGDNAACGAADRARARGGSARGRHRSGDGGQRWRAADRGRSRDRQDASAGDGARSCRGGGRAGVARQ